MIYPLSVEWSVKVPIISPFSSAGFCFMYLGGLFLGEASVWALKRSWRVTGWDSWVGQLAWFPTHSGEAVGWILWWILWTGGSSPSWDWTLYSGLSGAAGWDTRPAHSLFGDLSQAGIFMEGAGDQFHSANRLGHGLCSVQLPRSAGLSDGLCGFPRVLEKLPGQGRGWWLFAAVSAAADQFPCPSTAGEAAWKSLMLCLWSHTDMCPQFPGQSEPLVLLSGQSALPTRFSAQDLLGCTASGCSRQAFLSDGAGGHASQWVGLWLPPGKDCKGPFQASPKFSSTGFLVRRGQKPQSAARKAET